jgi:hypothetical protein
MSRIIEWRVEYQIGGRWLVWCKRPIAKVAQSMADQLREELQYPVRVHRVERFA